MNMRIDDAGYTLKWNQLIFSNLFHWKTWAWTLPISKFTKTPSEEKTADKTVGRTRGGLNTKLHATMDGLGNLVEIMLFAGSNHDSVHCS